MNALGLQGEIVAGGKGGGAGVDLLGGGQGGVAFKAADLALAQAGDVGIVLQALAGFAVAF